MLHPFFHPLVYGNWNGDLWYYPTQHCGTSGSNDQVTRHIASYCSLDLHQLGRVRGFERPFAGIVGMMVSRRRCQEIPFSVQ